MAKISKDQFAQRLYMKCIASGANALTYKELGLRVSVSDKRAWLLHKIEWIWTISAWLEMTTSGDALIAALTNSDVPTSFSYSQASIYTLNQIHRNDAGAAATGNIIYTPQITDLTTLPGGGILVPISPLYLANLTIGLASAATVEANVWYTEMELSDADYLQLLQITQVQT